MNGETPSGPPGAPPPPGGGYDPLTPFESEWEPEKPRSSGGLVAIGILNILFALVCGCTNGFGAIMLATFGESGSEVLVDKETWDSKIDQSFERQLDQEDDEEKRRQLEKAQRFLKSPEFRTVFQNVFRAVGESPTTSRLRTIYTIATILQACFLVSGIMLLMRNRFARPLTIFVAAATIAVNAATVISMNSFTNEVHDSLISQIEETLEGEQAPDLADETRDMIGEIADGFGGPVQGISLLFGIVASIYPFVALLVVMLAKGIADALGTPSPVQKKPSTF
ncbi:MAG: hypothetical protein CMJ83_21150 [Planctomycetes bacterium]|nr:hypothetical protein [Planctomycetota bacterium]